MRIAVTGTHRAGKSTLIDELSEHLPTYVAVDEPYLLLEDEGHEFAQPPSVEDFEAQLSRSIANLDDAPRDVLFDRCPVDFIGYLLAHEDSDAFDVDAWLPRVREAVQKLDLIVLVGIERPDRIARSASEDEELRGAVDEKLKELLLDEAYAFGVDVLEVEGPLSARVKQVLAHLSSSGRD
ncbi:AAA family ATPase [Myxococcus qinghaiensis]|uniref:AAA family ATPase n=1 Tax=Myxococcus qinghaiensis TaxID=2906758 RepID=UPI0020A7D52A|nr:AAA family ATPase [Myxococcus qinghaiensis]MCP3162335.1 ATP-binding protein [Myxococcus qinghaiensis]